MSHKSMHHVTHVTTLYATRMNAPSHTHEWDTSNTHMRMSHVAHRNESRRTYESCHIRNCSMPAWMRQVTPINESRQTHEKVMPHTQMNHDSYMNESAYPEKGLTLFSFFFPFFSAGEVRERERNEAEKFYISYWSLARLVHSHTSAYSVLQCVAVCCGVLQCVAVSCNVLQCVAVCCHALQCVVVCCNVLQCVTVCCSVLQCVAVCCSVLQCVAVWTRPISPSLALKMALHTLKRALNIFKTQNSECTIFHAGFTNPRHHLRYVWHDAFW